MSALIETIERGDAEGMAALYAADAVQHHPLAPAPLVGRDAIRDSEAELFASFSEVRIDRRSVLRDEDGIVALELVLSAVSTGPLDLGGPAPLTPTGRRIDLPAVWVLRLADDGSIAEERDYFDTGALLRQLGVEDEEDRADWRDEP